MSFEPKPKKKKTKDNDILPKPKRPMSAYNYFFQDQRKLILDSSDGDGIDENKMSFQDIGRLIGQRWREIKPDELAKYDEMAKEDLKRYREAMEIYRKEELALMCSGHVFSPNEDEDKKQPAVPQQKKPEDASSASVSQPKFNATSVDQLLHFQSMIEQQGYGNINKEELIKSIGAERANIKQRLIALIKESESLQMKDRILEQISVSCLAATNSGLNRAAFPHVVSSQPASFSGYDAIFQLQRQQLGAGLLGQLGNLNASQLQRPLAHAAFANQMPTQNLGHPASVSSQTSSQSLLGQYISSQQTAAAPGNGLVALQQAAMRGNASLLNAILAAQQFRGASAPAPAEKSNPDENEDATTYG